MNFSGGLHQDLVSRDPIWASLPDSPEVVTVLLFRHCCVRITAVVQILRGLGLDITDDEIRRYLTPSRVMATELALASPSETDANVLRIFNRVWRRVRLHLVPGDSPEQLFDLTVGREDVANENVQAILNSGNGDSHDERPGEPLDGDDGGHPERGSGVRFVTVEANDENLNRTTSRASARNVDEIMEVRPREEEELDYEADEPIDDGAEPEEGELPDESNGKTRSAAGEGDTQDEESGSDDSDDDDDDDEDSVRSVPNQSYAAVAADGNSGQKRTVTVSSTALYDRVGSATVTERGLVYLFFQLL